MSFWWMVPVSMTPRVGVMSSFMDPNSNSEGFRRKNDLWRPLRDSKPDLRPLERVCLGTTFPRDLTE